MQYGDEASCRRLFQGTRGTSQLVVFREFCNHIMRKCHDEFTSGSVVPRLMGIASGYAVYALSRLRPLRFSNVFFAPCQMLGRDHPCQHHNIVRYSNSLVRHVVLPVILMWSPGVDRSAKTALRLSQSPAQTRWVYGWARSYI